MTEVEIKAITKLYPASKGTKEVHVLDNISLRIRPGEFFTFVGPSGSGKSTLLNIIAGLDTATSGSIYFDDVDVSKHSVKDRDVAMVFQSYALYPHLSVYDNIAFPLRVRRVRKIEIDRDVQAMAEKLGLKELLKRRPRELSGGQRQRVSLARALIRRPRLFLMDEPLSNLDPQLRLEMRAEIKRIHNEFGITTVYVTHDQEEAMELSDRMAVLASGKLQQVASPTQIYSMPVNTFVSQFVGIPPMHFLPSGAVRTLHSNDNLIVGYRPSDVKLQPPINTSAIKFAGKITEVKVTGSDCWITIAVGADVDGPTNLTARTSASDRVAVNDPVSAYLLKEDLHFFSKETKIRLVGNETESVCTSNYLD